MPFLVYNSPLCAVRTKDLMNKNMLIALALGLSLTSTAYMEEAPVEATEEVATVAEMTEAVAPELTQEQIEANKAFLVKILEAAIASDAVADDVEGDDVDANDAEGDDEAIEADADVTDETVVADSDEADEENEENVA